MWTVPGVINNNAATAIACTNGDTGTVTVGVDVYGTAGAYVAGNSLPVAANATVIFATDNIPNVSVDVNLDVGIMSKGHARVFGSSTKVLCSAFLANIVSGVPTASLTVAKKFSQKGD